MVLSDAINHFVGVHSILQGEPQPGFRSISYRQIFAALTEIFSKFSYKYKIWICELRPLHNSDLVKAELPSS